MSDERLEIVKQMYEAFNRRDMSLLADRASPNFTWIPNPHDPEQAVHRGLDAVATALDEVWGSLNGLRTEPEELIDAGDKIVALVRHRAMVHGSDAPLDRREAHVWTFDDDELVELAEFPSREAALEAAGLAG